MDCIKAICHALRNDEEQDECAQLGCVWIGNDVNSATGNGSSGTDDEAPLFLRIALLVTLIAAVSSLFVYHVACRRKRDNEEGNDTANGGDDNVAIDNANDNMTVASLEEEAEIALRD